MTFFLTRLTRIVYCIGYLVIPCDNLAILQLHSYINENYILLCNKSGISIMGRTETRL